MLKSKLNYITNMQKYILNYFGVFYLLTLKNTIKVFKNINIPIFYSNYFKRRNCNGIHWVPIYITRHYFYTAKNKRQLTMNIKRYLHNIKIANDEPWASSSSKKNSKNQNQMTDITWRIPPFLSSTSFSILLSSLIF